MVKFQFVVLSSYIKGTNLGFKAKIRNIFTIIMEDNQRKISNNLFVDQDKVKLLNWIVHETGAIIVMHSVWRFWFDENLQSTRKEA